MSGIFDPKTPWRDALMPAAFNGAMFHCEVNSREGGRRIVVHQFPKKDLPYAEDMGRHAREFSVRGYCIVFPYDTNVPLYQRDYRVPRDMLLSQLEAGNPGILQLPTQPPQVVVCPRFRMTEEEKFGGYCVFDMTFVEYGVGSANNAPGVSTETSLDLAARVLAQNVIRTMTPPRP